MEDDKARAGRGAVKPIRSVDNKLSSVGEEQPPEGGIAPAHAARSGEVLRRPYSRGA